MHKNKLVTTAIIIFLIAAVLISLRLISNDTIQLAKPSTNFSHRSTPDASVQKVADVATALDAQGDVIDEYGPPKWYLSVTTTELMLRVTANPYREFEALEHALTNSPDNILLNALYFDLCAITLPAPRDCNLPMSDAFVQEAKQYRSLSKIYASWLHQQARYDEVLLLLNAMQNLPLSDSWLADKKIDVLRKSLGYGVEIYADVLSSYVMPLSNINAANHLQVCYKGLDDERYNTICHQLASQYEFPTIEYIFAQRLKNDMHAKAGLLAKDELAVARKNLETLFQAQGPYTEFYKGRHAVLDDELRERLDMALAATNENEIEHISKVLITSNESKIILELIEQDDFKTAYTELAKIQLDRNGY